MIGLLYHPPCLHFYFNSEHINHSSIISTLKPNQVRINERLRPLPTACNNCMQLLPLPLMLYQATQTQDWPEHVFFFFFNCKSRLLTYILPRKMPGYHYHHLLQGLQGCVAPLVHAAEPQFAGSPKIHVP